MPPIRVERPALPYVGRSLGDLLQLSGQHRADAERRSGEIAAQAWSNVGNIAAQAFSNYAKEKQEAPIRAAQTQQLQQQTQLGALQLDQANRADLDARRAKGISSAMDAVLGGALTTDPVTGLTTYDRNKLMAGMAEVGVPQSELGKYLPVLDAADKAITQAKALHTEALRHSASLVEMAGNDPSVFTSEIKRGIANGLFTQDEAQPYLDAAAKDPTHIGRITGALLGRDPNAGQFTLNPGDNRYGADGKLIVANPKAPEAPKPGTIEAYFQTYARDIAKKPVEQLTAAEQEDARKRFNQADDRPRITVNTGAATWAGDFEKTGDEFLKSIPAQWRTTVKKIANYEEDPTKVASMRGGNREMLTAWVNQVNPGYDTTMFSNRAPTRKAFTTGTQGQQINAINTAVGHIDQLTDQITALGNGDFTPGNKAANYFRAMFGSDKVTNFDTLKDALAGEVAGILSKGSATVSGIQEAKDKIHASSSPQQLAGYMKTIIPVMGSKLAALDYQYHQAMGVDDPFSALSPETRAVLTKHGFDPSGHGAASAVSVTAPNGKTYTFASQVDADAFKQKAGIK